NAFSTRFFSQIPGKKVGKSGFFLVFQARAVCQRGLRVNSSSLRSLGDPAKGNSQREFRSRFFPRVFPGVSQCYVFEVSGGGGAAERPRQVCPYIRLAWSRETPFPTFFLNPGFFHPLRPPTLDLRHVMELTELRKKLPEAAFRKKNYTGNDVCFQGFFCSLYEVEISAKDRSRLDPLLEKLKEKELVRIFWEFFPGSFSRNRGLGMEFLLSRRNSRLPTGIFRLFFLASVVAADDSSGIPSRNGSWIQDSQPVPDPSSPSSSRDEGAASSQKLPERSLAQLRRYLSDPDGYALGIAAALECLSGNSGSDSGNPSTPPDGFSKSFTSPTKPWGRENRRKSSRILRKTRIPGKNDGGSEEEAEKKSSASSFPKKSGSGRNSGQPMLKLANLKLPHGRKRGESRKNGIGSFPLLRMFGMGWERSGRSKEMSGIIPGKMVGNWGCSSFRGWMFLVKVGCRADPPSSESQSSGAAIPGNSLYPSAIPDFSLPDSQCESHALNLLAELALSSCIPAFLPEDSGNSRLAPFPISDHKYHRAEKQSRKSSPSRNLPEKSHPDIPASPPAEKTSGISSGNPEESREESQSSELDTRSIISAEHSYASPMPDDPKKTGNSKGNSHPDLIAPSKSGSRNSSAAPLVGKVLPFRHQRSGASELPGFPGKKEDFSKRHTVKVSGNSLRITCRWEEEYLFHLDSRYTNDALEKTVVRALHGPWSPEIPDDVEGMKLILHMWVALFYRKPSKLLSSSRKVVEHSNPRKFVSISSSGRFPELSDDSQDCFGFETRPADSGSDPDQIPSSSLDPRIPSQPERSPADSQTDADGAVGAVDSTVSSSSGEIYLWIVFQEEPLMDALSPSQDLRSPSKSRDAPSPENPGIQTPNSSTWTTPHSPQENREEQEIQREGEGGSGSGPGPPEDEEGTGDSRDSLEVEDDPQPPCDSVPLEANPGSAEPGGAAEESQEPSEHSEKEEREVEEKEKEELEDESPFLGPVGLVLSESSDAEMECERNPGNSAAPGELDLPEEDPVPSPTSPASPCPDGAGNDPRAFPEETEPNRDELPDPWDSPEDPGSDWDGLGSGSPGGPGSPPRTSPARGAQPDSGSESPGAAADALGNGSRWKNRDSPSGERWEHAGSAESPRGQGMALSPDSSSICLTSPDGSVDPWAAPEDPPGGSDHFPRLCGDGADPDLDSRDAEECNGSRSPAAGGAEELEDPTGSGHGRESPLDYLDVEDECRAGHGEDAFLGTENSPGNDGRSAEIEPEIPLHHQHLEWEPSSSSSPGVSAIKELPRQQRSFPSPSGDAAPISPAAGGSGAGAAAAPGRRQSVLCRLWKPCRDGGAVQVSVAAWSPDGSLDPGRSREPENSPDPRSPAQPGSAPLSPPWDEATEPGSPFPEDLPGTFPRSPDSARCSGSCGSPGSRDGEQPFPPQDPEGDGIPSPAPFPAWECPQPEPWDSCEHNPEGSPVFPDPDCAEAGEGEIPASPIPASPWDEHGDVPGENLEFSEAEDFSDGLPREEQLPSQDADEGSAFRDPSENSFGDSDQEYWEGNSHSPIPSRNSCTMQSTDAAGSRTTQDSSPGSPGHTEQHRGIPWDSRMAPAGQCRERTGKFQHPKRCGRRSQESHLARSLLGTWRGSEGITQSTLDMECLRFHYKLKEILRNVKHPFSTSKSIFPMVFPAGSGSVPPSPRSRSPLRVTIPLPAGLRCRSHGSPSRDSRECRKAAPRLGKLRYERVPSEDPQLLWEFHPSQEFLPKKIPPKTSPARESQPAEATAVPSCHFQVALRPLLGWAFPFRYSQEIFSHPSSRSVFQAVLKAEGLVRVEPRELGETQRRRQLLVVVRNEDISSHIHSVPCLLELKRCPHVVFAGVDDPEDVAADTFQELFQAGGFVVSDEELLERVTLGQLQQVVKVLEQLNRSGSWKWLLHHGESRRLRGDLRYLERKSWEKEGIHSPFPIT
uniref:Uncharacterized protein n=1 Tax=Cyanistes caeruleus TaxID=156563 RepID=A0A8C0U5Y9_CYACU